MKKVASINESGVCYFSLNSAFIPVIPVCLHRYDLHLCASHVHALETIVCEDRKEKMKMSIRQSVQWTTVCILLTPTHFMSSCLIYFNGSGFGTGVCETTPLIDENIFLLSLELPTKGDNATLMYLNHHMFHSLRFCFLLFIFSISFSHGLPHPNTQIHCNFVILLLGQWSCFPFVKLSYNGDAVVRCIQPLLVKGATENNRIQ